MDSPWIVSPETALQSVLSELGGSYILSTALFGWCSEQQVTPMCLLPSLRLGFDNVAVESSLVLASCQQSHDPAGHSSKALESSIHAPSLDPA